jgi:hypothetical protein
VNSITSNKEGRRVPIRLLSLLTGRGKMGGWEAKFPSIYRNSIIKIRLLLNDHFLEQRVIF